MGDKEPRRRKKRKDSQKKEDVRSEDNFFLPPKMESKDSDVEVEEDTVIHSHHQPSNLAKIVFVILFSGLIVSLSFIFISLRDTDRSSLDISEVSHEEHGEALHDEPTEEALHGDHHDHPEESEIRLEDFISGLSSIFSRSTEEDEESDQDIHSEDSQIAEDKETINSESSETESSTDQGLLEEYVEDTSEQLPPESIEKPSPSIAYPDSSASYSEDEAVYSTFDYSETEDISASTVEPDVIEPPPQSFSETVDLFDDDEQDSFSIYERADITNEADFGIRDQLDEIDGKLDKESNDDEEEEEEGDDEDEDDDDEEESVEEEFDFWQF